MPLADPCEIASPERRESLQETGLLDGPLDAHNRLNDALAAARETTLDYSFCQHMVSADAPLIIPDARVHHLVHDNHAINEHGMHAYAGMPLGTSAGQVLGSFCVFYSAGRKWLPEDLLALGVARVEADDALRRIGEGRPRVGGV